MAYLKHYYHIDEVADILAKHDPMIDSEAVVELGLHGLLNIGLLTDTDVSRTWFLNLSSLKATDVSIAEVSTLPTTFYKTVARNLFDGRTHAIAQETDDEHKYYLTTEKKEFLNNYRMTNYLFKVYPFIKSFTPLLEFNSQSQTFRNIEDYTIANFSLDQSRPHLIYPNYSYDKHSWLKSYKNNSFVQDCDSYTSTNGDILIPIIYSTDAFDIRQREESLFEPIDELDYFPIYEFVKHNTYIKDLINQNRLYISRRELMRFEQIELGIKHGLDLNEYQRKLIKSEQNQELPNYIDPENENYAIELDIAIKAHHAVVLDGWKAKTNYGGYTGHLKAWLEEYYPDASAAFIERIATVANPKKEIKKLEKS